MSLLFGSTFKHGILVNAGGGGATTGLVNRKYWDTVNGTGYVVDTTTVPPGCPASLSFPAAITAAANVTRILSDNQVCFGFWFRKVGATNPSAVNPRIIGFSTSNHTVRLNTSGALQIGAAGSGFQTILTPAADTWYWITVRVDTSTGTHTVDAKAYDDTGALVATATQSTSATAATPQLSFVVGTAGSMGGASVLVGCVVLDDNHANYPLLPMACDLLVPVATGTHSFTAGNFQDDTATNLATNETTSWAKVDETPANTTDYVRQVVDNANAYLEYDYGPTTAGLFSDVQLVQQIAANLPSTTGANLVGHKLNDGGTITAEATIDQSTAAGVLEYLMHGYTVRPNGGGAWTTTAVDALRGRFGYMTLQPAQAGLSAFYLEVFGTQVFGGGGTAYTPSVGDTLGLTDATVRSRGSKLAPADTLGLTDARTFARGSRIADTLGLTDATAKARGSRIADTLGLTDATTRSQGAGRSLADILGLTDATTRVRGAAVTVGDTLGLTDANARVRGSNVTVGDTLGLTDATAKARGKTIADPIGLTDSATPAKFRLQPVADGFALTDSPTRVHGHVWTQGDAFGLTDATAKSRAKTVADPFGLTDSAATAKFRLLTLGDTLGLTDARSLKPGKGISDTLGLTDALARARGKTIADPFGLTDAAGRGFGRTVADTLGLTDARAVARGVRIADALGLTDQASRLEGFARTIADTFGLTDQATPAAAGAKTKSLSDTIGLTDALAKTRGKVIGDVLGLTDARTAVSAHRTTLPDTLGLTDAAARVMAFSRSISDGLALTDQQTPTLTGAIPWKRGHATTTTGGHVADGDGARSGLVGGAHSGAVTTRRAGTLSIIRIADLDG